MKESTRPRKERTPFGKELARLRIDRGLLLREMAEYADVASSFLSAVEFGRKSVPATVVERLAKVLGLDLEETRRLRNMAARQSARQVRIDLDDSASTAHREVAAALARRFADLSRDKVEQIRRMLATEEEG